MYGYVTTYISCYINASYYLCVFNFNAFLYQQTLSQFVYTMQYQRLNMARLKIQHMLNK
jgi:hypothetical protein